MDSSLRFAPFRMTVRLASASRLSLHLVCHSERSEESTANEEFPLTSPCFGYRRNVPLLAKERDVAERQGEVTFAHLARDFQHSKHGFFTSLCSVQNDSASARHWSIISSIHILFRACIHLILTQPKSGLIGIARKIV
jgi:hypothetical protein